MEIPTYDHEYNYVIYALGKLHGKYRQMLNPNVWQHDSNENCRIYMDKQDNWGIGMESHWDGFKRISAKYIISSQKSAKIFYPNEMVDWTYQQVSMGNILREIYS